MTKTITLELPDSVIERAQAAAERSGNPLETVLTGWLEQVAQQDLESLLISEGVHTIYTPVGSDAAAEDLWKILQEHQSGKPNADKIQL
jgi:hypothetical protein